MQTQKVKEVTKRFPIILNNHAIAVIHIFERHDCLEDMWMDDCFHGSVEMHTKAAEQMIEQLKDQWTPAFLMALRDAITKTLEEHDNEFGTSFA